MMRLRSLCQAFPTILLLCLFSSETVLAASSTSTTTTTKTILSPKTRITPAKRADSNGKVFFPSGKPVINNIDVLDVSYTTNWDHANMTLWCETNEELKQWVHTSRPLIEENGTFSFNPVQEKMDIPQFPVVCHIDLRNPKDEDDYVLGGEFTMTSTAGAVSTWMDATARPTAIQTTAAGGSSGKTTGNPTPDGDNGSSGLSSGATIGIGVGVGVGVLLIGAAAAFVIWRKRVKSRERRSNIVMPGRGGYGDDSKESYQSYDYSDREASQMPVESGGRSVSYYPTSELDGSMTEEQAQRSSLVAELPSEPVNTSERGRYYGR